MRPRHVTHKVRVVPRLRGSVALPDSRSDKVDALHGGVGPTLG